MQEIALDVYVLDDYWGITAGAVIRESGTLLVDSPPCPQHSRLWRARCRGFSRGETALVYLDAHPDRTLGSRMLEAPIIAHSATVDIFRRRAAIFRVNDNNRGHAWELCSQIANMRWMPPQMGFSYRLEIHWGGEPLVLENHPGPQEGAVWVFVPDRRVVFVGDSVTVTQPPFLAEANIDAWLASLDLLLAPDYRDYFIVSGRDGLVPVAAIHHMQKFLMAVKTLAEGLKNAKPTDGEFVSAVAELLAMWPKPEDDAVARLYKRRLVHGLYSYLNGIAHHSHAKRHKRANGGE